MMRKLLNEGIVINRKTFEDIFIATRPLSLTLAIYSTTIGIVIAYMEGFLFNNTAGWIDIWKIVLVTLGGIVVQTGTNLINDYFECDYKYRKQSSKRYKFLGKDRTRFDIVILILGIGCFLMTSMIGLYLIYITTAKLLVIGIIGVIGGYSYTGQPIVYKKRGLGTILSFILMGPLMVYGSHLVFSETFSWSPILIGLPVSLLIPVLMLSNELRDYERDQSLGIKTLTVRTGFKFGRNLYLSLLLSAYGLIILYVCLKIIPSLALLVLLTIPLAMKSYRQVAMDRKGLVPITNKLHLSFGLLFILAITIGA